MNFWKSDGVLSEKVLSSLNIRLVADNTSLLIGVQQFAEPMVISAISQDIETYSAFTLVVWLFNIFLLKEKCEIILSNSKDALVRKSWHLFIVIQGRSVYLILVRRLISLHIS